MKKIIIFGLFILNLANCQEKKVQIKTNNENNFEKTKKMEITPIYTIKVSVANPYEILVNDMPFDKNFEKGSTNFELPINDLILQGGMQRVKVILHPDIGKNVVDKSGLDYLDVKIYKYKDISSIGNDGELVKSINLKDMKEAPIVAKEELVFMQVPYKLKGWIESEDLSKEDKTKLINEVVLKYKSLSNLLNNGDLKGFFNENKTRDLEVNKSFYDNEQIKAEDKEYMEDRILKSKGNMAEFYLNQVTFYGDGKVVTLEMRNGKSALYGDDGENLYYYMVLLHRPKFGMPLEIIR